MSRWVVQRSLLEVSLMVSVTLSQLNAFHTVELELNHSFEIQKDYWDEQHIDRLEEACRPGRDVRVVVVCLAMIPATRAAQQQADVIVIVMDSGLAKLCSISEHITTVLASIEVPMPKKRPGASTHGKAVDKFFHLVMEV
jgi:protein pelota